MLNRVRSEPAAVRWAGLVTERTGFPLLGTVTDLSHVGSADLLETSDEHADPWVDAFAAGVDVGPMDLAHARTVAGREGRPTVLRTSLAWPGQDACPAPGVDSAAPFRSGHLLRRALGLAHRLTA